MNEKQAKKLRGLVNTFCEATDRGHLTWRAAKYKEVRNPFPRHPPSGVTRVLAEDSPKGQYRALKRLHG